VYYLRIAEIGRNASGCWFVVLNPFNLVKTDRKGKMIDEKRRGSMAGLWYIFLTSSMHHQY
jgi:hypothetical protein